jgi:hypothetical protein
MTEQPPNNQTPQQPPPDGPPPGQPYYVYQEPPKKKHTVRTVVITLTAVFVVVVGGISGCAALVLGGSSGSDDPGHSQVAPDDGGSAPKDGHAAKKKPAAKATHDPRKFGWWYDAKKDVAVNGIANSDSGRHVTYTVTNQSNKTLDYDITFGLYDSNGTRVGETYGMPMNVAPGEHLVVTDPTEGYIDSAPGAATAKVLSVDAEQSDGS